MQRIMRCNASSFILIATACAVFSSCLALPQYFLLYDSALTSQYPTYTEGSISKSCRDQPSQAYGGHPSLQDDGTGTTISTTAQQTPQNSICKGVPYDVQVVFGGGTGRYALLTVTGGVLGDDALNSHLISDRADDCAGQRLLVQPGTEPVKEFNTTVTVPCNSEIPLMLSLTSSTGANDPLYQIRQNFTVVSCSAACTSTHPTVEPTTPGSNDDVAKDEEDSSRSGTGSSAPIVSSGSSSGSSRTAAAVLGSLVGGSGTKCAAATTGCTPSTYGYTCQTPGSASTIVHYSYSTCVPDNECTRGAKWLTAVPGTEVLLHMSAEADTPGYVALGFTKNSGRMAMTDAVLGYIDSTGQGNINVYPLSREDIDAPYPSSMLSYQGVVKTSAGKTIICFARPISNPAFKYSPTLDPTNLQLNAAVGRRPALTLHRAAGGLTVNTATGAASAEDSGGGDTLIYVHGTLMVIAWIGLAPFGALLARHKWALGERKLAGIHLWFQSHRTIQVTAVATAAVAFVIALTKLDAGETAIGKAHKLAGIIVIAMAGFQVLAAIPRPHPGTPHRMKWNLLHWWLGRTSVLLAIAVCFLGVALFHNTALEPYPRWLVPMCFWLGVLVVVDIVLSLMKLKQGEKLPVAEHVPDSPQARGGMQQPSHSPNRGVV